MPVFWYFLIASELGAFVVGSYYFKKIRYKYVFLYIFVLVGVSTELHDIIRIKLGAENMMWVSHIYFPLEFLSLSLFYVQHLIPVIKRRLITWIIFAYIVFAVINATFIQSIEEYSQTRIFSSLILVLFALVYFYKVLVEAKIQKLFTEPMIWINVAVLLYYSTTFFYNILINRILDYSYQMANYVGIFNGYMIVLFYVFITIALRMEGRQRIKMKHASLKWA